MASIPVALVQPTRLVVTNLAPSVQDLHLRQHVQRCPPHPPSLTDARVLQKPDGTSRRLAFLGFKSYADAHRVLEWLQQSWVQGSRGGARVRVDWAKDTNEAPPPRKRSRILPPSPSAAAMPPLVPQPTASTSGAKQDDRFAEFMSVMAPRRNRAVEVEPSLSPTISAVTSYTANSSLQRATASHHGNSTTSTSIEHAKRSPALNSQDTPSRPIPEEEERQETADGAAEDETISDMDYMARRMKRSLEEAEAEEESGQDGTEWEQDLSDHESADGTSAQPRREAPDDGASFRPTAGDAEAENLLLEHGRLFMRNLAYSVTQEDLQSLLEPFGAVQEIHVPIDAANKSSKGLAYATFASPACAVEAYRALDARSFQGRLLHLIPAVGSRLNAQTSKENGGGIRNERLEARKRASANGLSWATLYMNSDAVMSSVAERLGMSKAALLDPTSDNAAVRVALAETHVIIETKKYFEAEGINLSSFSTRGPRSPTTILVKNIPYGTTAATLTTLFAPFGTVSRLLLPPSGTMAIVEMADAPSASSAWRQLAYKKLGSSVLYLEKAPAGLFASVPRTDNPAALPSTAPSEATSAPMPRSKQHTTAPQSGDPEQDAPVDGSTLFVKNLAFATTTETLRTSFGHLPDFLFARVQTKVDPKVPGRQLSMGFGFVGFRTPEAADRAKQSRNGFSLDGHRLEIRFARRGAESPSKASGTKPASQSSATTTKLLVKNVPFEATRKEIRELFSAHGQLKSVRLPRKVDHKTRGFAFLDFATRRDAESAFAALEHTHLLGRHLVLQWADKDDTDVESLRARTTLSSSGMGGKKSRFTMTSY